MTDFSLTASGTDHSAPAVDTAAPANVDANTAAAFQTVLNALRTFDLTSADSETVAAFQTVLDAMTSFGQVPVATATPASATTATPPVATPPAPAAASTTVILRQAAPALPVLRTTGPWNVGFLFIVVPPQHLTAIPDPPLPAGEEFQYWYCISKGRFVGITLSHGFAMAGTLGVSGAQLKAYRSQIQALDAFNQYLDFHMVTVVP
ncbi:hypothetical protein R3P38DRAFT_3230797 [Favolaschia claudopus]|uniref:Uncharacterized protein n=1 Tax=Favolaschia claudopus TaxID=2862362 RepID=A0AAV9ZLQ1_9AGAR